MLQAVYGLWGGSVIILKSESPGIDKWGYGDIECAISFIGYALGNTEASMNMLSVAVLFPLFILDMVDFGLKVDRDLSTFFNSASISFFRLFSLWYVIEYTVPNTNPLSC